MREMLTGGDLDYVTGDYLAELTMLILARDRPKSPDRGYAKTFLTQLEESPRDSRSTRACKIVANAGGLNPAGLAAAVRALADRLGLDANVAHVEGDDLVARADELGFGTPLAGRQRLPRRVGHRRLPRRGRRRRRHRPGHRRVGDRRARRRPLRLEPTDYDALAGAVAAGHVIECGVQATGGNFAFFTEVARPVATPGFPIAEIDADGSSVITKHPGTGGAGQRRHRHRAAALRDRRRALRQPRRRRCGSTA